MSSSTVPTQYGPLPDTSIMTQVNNYFDTNLPCLKASASSAQASVAGRTQDQGLPSLTEHVKTLKAYVDRKDNAGLNKDELAAYAQLSVWHDKHAEALGGFFGSFTDARRVLTELEHQAAQDFINSTERLSAGTYSADDTLQYLSVPLDLVNAAKTFLQGPQTHVSGQVIYLGNGTFRRQSSYDVSNIEQADGTDSAPADMCINYFATKDDELKRLYQMQGDYMLAFDDYARTMARVTSLRESVRQTSQPKYDTQRFRDAYDFQPRIHREKKEVQSDWVQKGYSVQGYEPVVLPSADLEVDAGPIWDEPQ